VEEFWAIKVIPQLSVLITRTLFYSVLGEKRSRIAIHWIHTIIFDHDYAPVDKQDFCSRNYLGLCLATMNSLEWTSSNEEASSGYNLKLAWCCHRSGEAVNEYNLN
jgi:hypothetical protein